MIVTLPDIQVVFCAGEKGRPIAEQAPSAFARLEAGLPSLRGCRFYGAVINGEYRACLDVASAPASASLPCQAWTIPGGRYRRVRIPDWEENVPLIGEIFARLRQRPDSDPSRPGLEFYRSRKELFVMVPVR